MNQQAHNQFPLPKLHFSRVVSIGVGLLLLAAAGLKIHALATDPLSQDGFVTSPWLHLAIIELELLMAIWLLSGLSPRSARMVTFLIFLGFAIISLNQALSGQASCGCFGKVNVNPWITFCIDVAAMVAIFLNRPPTTDANPVFHDESVISPALSFIWQTTLIMLLMASLVIGGFLLLTDDPGLALARLRGETLSVEPSVVDVGAGEEGTSKLVPVRLFNHENRPVKVLGGASSCVCITLIDLPIIVPPKSNVTVHIRVLYKGGQGRFTHGYKFFHAANEQTVFGRFTGTVTLSKQKQGLSTASK